MIIYPLLINHQDIFLPLESFSENWKDNQGEICAYGKVEDDICWIYVKNIGYYSLAKDVVSAYPDHNTPEVWVWDTYYRTALPLMLQAKGHEILHASAVNTTKGLVALCARSETGKSTLAYGLSQRNYPLWADDAVSFEIKEQVIAVQLPFSIRLRKASADFYQQPDRDHQQIITRNITSELASIPFRCLFILERLPENAQPIVTVQPIRGSEAFPKVLSHAYSFSLENPVRKQKMMEQYLTFVNKVPIFSLAFKAGLENVENILDEVEKTLSAL